MEYEKTFRFFLDHLCVEFGVCLPPSQKEQIVSRDFFEADDFVKEVLSGEGLDASKELHLFRQMRREFTDRFGGDIGNSWIS